VTRCETAAVRKPTKKAFCSFKSSGADAKNAIFDTESLSEVSATHPNSFASRWDNARLSYSVPVSLRPTYRHTSGTCSGNVPSPDLGSAPAQCYFVRFFRGFRSGLTRLETGTAPHSRHGTCDSEGQSQRNFNVTVLVQLARSDTRSTRDLQSGLDEVGFRGSISVGSGFGALSSDRFGSAFDPPQVNSVTHHVCLCIVIAERCLSCVRRLPLVVLTPMAPRSHAAAFLA